MTPLTRVVCINIVWAVRCASAAVHPRPRAAVIYAAGIVAWLLFNVLVVVVLYNRPPRH